MTETLPRDSRLDGIVHTAAGLAGCRPADVVVRPVPYAFGSPATAGIWQVCAPDRQWCVKAIQHPRHWPGLQLMPPELQEGFAAEFPWRFELDMEESGIAAVMPPGLRTARLDRVETPDDEHATLWWEWIDDDGSAWTRAQYLDAARALGRLAARRREGAPANAALPGLCLRVPHGFALRMYAERRTLCTTVPVLRDPGVRAHPVVQAALAETGPGVWDDMLVLASRIPSLLDALDGLPQTFAHGDASPQNLLRPSAEPGTFVAIDWGFGSLLAVGFDLGQLLVGLVHAGLAPASQVPELADDVVAAYAEGCSLEGWDVGADPVRRGFVGSVLCRSVLDSVPLDALEGEPDAARTELMAERLRLCRALLDLDGGLGLEG